MQNRNNKKQNNGNSLDIVLIFCLFIITMIFIMSVITNYVEENGSPMKNMKTQIEKLYEETEQPN